MGDKAQEAGWADRVRDNYAGSATTYRDDIASRYEQEALAAAQRQNVSAAANQSQLAAAKRRRWEALIQAMQAKQRAGGQGVPMNALVQQMQG